MENGLGITTKLFRAISKLFSIHYTLKSSENYMVLYIMFSDRLYPRVLKYSVNFTEFFMCRKINGKIYMLF